MWGNPTINIPQDAVQEFKVFRNQFDAEYGSALAAVVSVVTKSGTNAFTGTLSYFGRDKALNGKNYFATGEKPPFDQTRVGGTVGGPCCATARISLPPTSATNLNTVKIIALPANNPFAATQQRRVPVGLAKHGGDGEGRSSPERQQLAVRALGLRRSVHDPHRRHDGRFAAGQRLQPHAERHRRGQRVMSKAMVNTVRFQFMNHDLGTVPNSFDLSIARPSASFGQDTTVPQDFPRKRYQVFDTFYINSPAHDLKFGGDFEFAHHEYDAHFFQPGYFQFGTDLPFDGNNRTTWPISFTMQTPGHWQLRFQGR